ARVVVIGVGKGVVRDELEAVAGALFGLDLQRVVLIVGVVAEVASIDRAAAGSWMDDALSVGARRSGISESGHAVEEIPSAIRLRHRRHERLLAIEPRCRCSVGCALISKGSGADRGFVVVVRRSLASEDVCSLITDIAGGK